MQEICAELSPDEQHVWWIGQLRARVFNLIERRPLDRGMRRELDSLCDLAMEMIGNMPDGDLQDRAQEHIEAMMPQSSWEDLLD